MMQMDTVALPKFDLVDYELKKRLGEGSFSEVFQVTLRTSSAASTKSFALKRLKTINKRECYEDQEQEERHQHQQLHDEEGDSSEFAVLKEASILAGLNHKNIIRAVGISESPPMLLLTLLDGTLEDRLKVWREQERIRHNNRIIPGTSNVLRRVFVNNTRKEFRTRTEHIVRGIANGLEYLHSKNIIMRDLKPENVGFDFSGEVKLFDFGCSCHIDDRRERQNLAGSLRYMPQEMLQVAVLDERSSCEESPSNETTPKEIGIQSTNEAGFANDIYSFGIVLWEMAALERAHTSKIIRKRNKYPNKSLAEILLDHVIASKGSGNNRKNTPFANNKLRRIPDAHYRTLISQCCDYRPADRPSSTSICDIWLDKIYPDHVEEEKKVGKTNDWDYLSSIIYKAKQNEIQESRKKRAIRSKKAPSTLLRRSTVSYHGSFDDYTTVNDCTTVIIEEEPVTAATESSALPKNIVASCSA